MRLDAATQEERLRIALELGVIDAVEIVVPEDRDVVLDDVRLHYLDWPASRGARNVLLLHGGLLTAHTWDLLSLQLRPAFHFIALDQRGHGDSEWPLDVDYSTDAFVGDLERFVETLGLVDFVLVGMSLGGLNSIEYAARHSGRIRGLVLVDVGPELHVDSARRIGVFARAETEVDSIEVFVERAVASNPLRHRELLRTGVMHNVLQLPDGKWTWKHDPRFGRWVRHDYERLAERLHEIRCPALVVRGEHSEIFWDEDAERVVARMPDARWVKIPDAGHTVQGDNPRALAAALKAFLTEIGT